jgi:small subunit ribosomal protein S5
MNETTEKNNIPAEATVTTPVAPTAPVKAPAPAFGDKRRRGASTGGPRRNSRERDNRERVKPEFDSKIISIRRVTRVTSGGRRMSFSVAVVAGDRKGRVGVGIGKSGDTSIAIDKATRDAKKNMHKITLTPQMTIPHAIDAKYSSARIIMMPARGRGIVAGSSVRTVIELAGIKDIAAKIMTGSKNKINNARGAIKALSTISKVNRNDLIPAKK